MYSSTFDLFSENLSTFSSMVFTRADQREALQHVLHEVLVLEDNDPIPSAFAHHGITTITDLVNFPHEDIHTLTYLSEDGLVKLHRGNVGLQKLSKLSSLTLPNIRRSIPFSNFLI